MSRLKKLDVGQAEPKANELMTGLQKNNMLLNIFRGMANSPAVLDSYLKFSGAMKESKLDGRTREAIALVVGQSNRCDYCLAAHTFLGGKAGLDEAAIKDARLGRSKDKKTAGAVALAKQIAEKKGNVTESDIAAARSAGLDDGELAEVVALVALNVFTNYFNHLNQTEVDLPKVALDVA